MHAPHHALAGYDEGNVLHDGCAECEARAAAPLDGLMALDHVNRAQLWRDMRAHKWSGGAGLDRNLSDADAQMLTALYRIAVFLERAGIGPDEVERRMVVENQELERVFG